MANLGDDPEAGVTGSDGGRRFTRPASTIYASTIYGRDDSPPPSRFQFSERHEPELRVDTPPPRRFTAPQAPSIRIDSPRPPTPDLPDIQQPTVASSKSEQGNEAPSHGHDPEIDESFEDWIWKNYGKFLVRKVAPWPLSKHHGRAQSFEVSFAEMQRVHILKLRAELAQSIARYCGKGREGREGYLIHWEWQSLIHNYIEALKNYEYMDKFTKGSPGSDPFHLSGEYKLDRIILERAFRDLDSNSLPNLKRRPRFVSQWHNTSGPIIPSRSDNYWSKLSSRIVVSLVSAAFLIGPMWLMMLDTRRDVALASTTAFVVAFGILMAWRLEEHNQVLSSTAAYAAVLVVFVGLRGEAPLAEPK
ncbi:hypothetical protein QBC43DRAFT_304811 [Cladorrhinum sp. PSN259]|nr:hypothetical protein QBC43DRAFT_304811 [Cladorrhinum sp. PSN259]